MAMSVYVINIRRLNVDLRCYYVEAGHRLEEIKLVIQPLE